MTAQLLALPLSDAQIANLMAGAFPRTKCSPAYITFARLVEAAVRANYRWAAESATQPKPYDGVMQGIRDEVDANNAAHAVGRDAGRPGDLVPLANGRSVDLGGRWNIP